MGRIIKHGSEMSIIEIINEVERTYIEYLPNLNKMKELGKEYGLDVRYRDGFCERWYNWLTFNDCRYEVKPSEEGMRNYTA